MDPEGSGMGDELDFNWKIHGATNINLFRNGVRQMAIEK